MSDKPEVKVRAGQVVKDRRIQLGLKQSDLKDRGGPSEKTVIKFEQGNMNSNVQARTTDGFDRALQWQLGSTAAVLRGGNPMPLLAEAVQHATSSTQRPSVNTWVRVPRCTIQNLSIAVAKAAIILIADNTQMPPEALAALREIQSEVQLLTGIVDSLDRGDTELLLMVDSNTPLDTHELRVESPLTPGGSENSDGEG